MKDWLEIIGRAFEPYGAWWGMPAIYRVPVHELRTGDEQGRERNR